MNTQLSYADINKYLSEIQLHAAEAASQLEKYNQSLTPSMYPYEPNKGAIKEAFDQVNAIKIKNSYIFEQLQHEDTTATTVPVPSGMNLNQKTKKKLFGFSRKSDESSE